MTEIYLSSARKVLESPGMHSLKCWTSKGAVRHFPQCVSLRHDRRSDCRNIKIYPSGEIRKISDYLIFEIDDMEVCL